MLWCLEVSLEVKSLFCYSVFTKAALIFQQENTSHGAAVFRWSDIQKINRTSICWMYSSHICRICHSYGCVTHQLVCLQVRGSTLPKLLRKMKVESTGKQKEITGGRKVKDCLRWQEAFAMVPVTYELKVPWVTRSCTSGSPVLPGWAHGCLV